MICFPAVGAPLLSISLRSAPVILEASSAGLAMVAEQQMNCGFEP
jgi:hypothetical protein